MCKLFLVLVTLLTVPNLLFGQKESKTSLVKLPAEIGVASILSQPDCPLKVIDAEAMMARDPSRPIVRYVLQNTSRKGIIYFSVATIDKYSVLKWKRFGLGGELGVGGEDGKGSVLIPHGGKYTNLQRTDYEIVKWSSDLDRLLSDSATPSKLKFFSVVMVTKIIFEDGSVYDQKNMHNELLDLVEQELVTADVPI